MAAAFPIIQDWTQFSSSFPAKPSVPAKPGYLSTIDIASLGTKVKRISDFSYFSSNVSNFDTGNDRMLNHHYARRQVWNSDQTKILLFGSWRWCAMLNADGSYDRTLQQAGIGRCWSNTSPHHIFTIDTSDTSQVYKVDVRDDSKVLIVDTPYNLDLIGKTEGNLSDDDRYMVSSLSDGGNIRIVVIDLLNSSYNTFVISRSYSEMDWCSISSKGGYVVVAYNSGVRDVDLYSKTGSKIRRITNQQHADLGTDSNGDECIYVVGHVEETPGTAVVKHRLSDNQKTILFGGNNEFENISGQPVLDGHISASASQTGFVHVSAYSSSGGPHVLFAVKDDGSRKVAYYAFHNSVVVNDNYDAQPHFNVSRDGTLGIFKSNWGNSSGHTELYIAWREASANTAPVLTDPPDQSVEEGQSVSIGLTFTDAENDPVTGSLVSGPAWASVSNNTLTLSPPLGTTLGDYSVVVKGNDGQADSAPVTVVCTVTASTGGGGGLAFTVNVQGGTQSFETGRSIANAGAHGGSGSIPPPRAFGHYFDTGITYANGNDYRFTETKNFINNMHANYPQIKGFLHRFRWNQYETTSSQFNGVEVAQLEEYFNICDANGQKLILYPKDIEFGYTDLTKARVPLDIYNAGGAAQSGPPSNPAVCGKLWEQWVMDRWIAFNIELYNRYGHHPSFMGIYSPETTRSFWSGSTVINVGDEMLAQYKRMATQIKAVMQDNYFWLKINFFNTVAQLYEFADHIDALGGCVFSWPDSVPVRDPANPVSSDYKYDVYTVARAKRGIMTIGPSAETRDAPDDPNDIWDMFFNMGADSINPNMVIWHDWHPNVSNWFQLIMNMLAANNYHINTTIPSNDATITDDGGAASGEDPDNSTVSHSGSVVSITPQSSAVAGTSDPFTIEFDDNLGTDEPATINYTSVAVPDGTPTIYEPILFKPGPGDVVSGATGDQTWTFVQDYADYTGSGHMLAGGSYNAGDKTEYRIGDYIFVNLAAILPNSNDHRAFFHDEAVDVNSDSYWAEVQGTALVNGGDQYIDYKNEWGWEELWHSTINAGTSNRVPRTVNAADGWLKLYVREPGAAIDSIVFIDAQETALPSGRTGYTQTVSVSVDAGNNITAQVSVPVEIQGIVNPANTPGVISYNWVTNSTGLDIANVGISDIGNGNFSVTATVTATAAGAHIVELAATTENGIFKDSMTVTASGGEVAVWPDGISATLPETKTVEVGESFTLTPYPQNPAGFVLSDDRWSHSGASVALQSSSNSAASYVINAPGQVTISYTMQRADDPSAPQIYQTVVTVLPPATEDWPGTSTLFIGGDRNVVDGSLINVRSSEYTGLYDTTAAWSSPDTGVAFGSLADQITTITTPGPGDYEILREVVNAADPGGPTLSESFTLRVLEKLNTLSPAERFCSLPRIVVEFETAGGRVYVRDFPSTPVPDGAVVLDATIETGGISTVSQRVDFRKGSGDIGTATIKITDINRGFSDWLKEVLDSGDSLKDRPVRIYRFCDGDFWNPDKLWRTYIFNKYSAQDNVYTISTMDVQRHMQTDIFDPHAGRLTKSITAEQLHIPLARDDESFFKVLQHTDDYRIHPGQAVGYARIKKTGEVFAYDSIFNHASDGLSFRVIGNGRGVFQTTAASVQIAAGTSDDNLPAIEEIVYIEGPAPEVAYQLLTGVSRDAAITLPEHWSAKVPVDLVDLESINNLGDDIESIQLEFTNPKKQTGKKWIEEQCFVPMTVAPLVNAAGALTLKRAALATPDASFLGVITPDDIVSYGQYSTDFGTIRNGILLNWGWNWLTERFVHPTLIVDSESAVGHGHTEFEKVELKGLQSSASTTVSVRRLADVMRGHLSHESLSLSIGVMPDRDFYDAGDVVRLELGELVKDPSGAAIELSRSMIITRRSEDLYTGAISYELAGIGRPVNPVSGSENDWNIPAANMKSGATDLSTVCSITGGEIQSTNLVPAGVYYYEGDLSHNAGNGQIIQSTPGTIELRVIGAYNPYHPESIVTTGQGKPAGGGGYFGHIRSANGLKSTASWKYSGGGGGDFEETTTRTLTDLPGNSVRGVVSAIPVLPLRLEAGKLSGYPRDLLGSGSPGGGAAVTSSQEPTIPPGPLNETTTDGGAGAAGGGGIIIISRGGSTGPSGGFKTSGHNGSPGTLVPGEGIYSGASAGGMPGALLWLLDGNHFAPELQGRVEANSGAVTLAGEPATNGQITQTHKGPWRPSVDPSPQRDYAAACVSVQFVPPDSVPQLHDNTGDAELSPYLSNRLAEIAALAESQVDDQAKVYVDDAKPSFGVAGDFWVATAERNAAGYPTIYQHDGTDYVYISPDTSFAAQVLQLQYGTSYIADSKGAVYLNASTDPNPPSPKSVSDLWMQPDTGRTYAVMKTAGGLAWNPKPITDEYFAPSGANILHDPNFEQIVNDGKLTWRVEGANIEHEFGAYGEGAGGVIDPDNSPGVIITSTTTSDIYAQLIGEHYYPASVGDDWRLTFRSAIYQAPGRIWGRITLCDKNKTPIGYAEDILGGLDETGTDGYNGAIFRYAGGLLPILDTFPGMTLFPDRNIGEVTFIRPDLWVSLQQGSGEAHSGAMIDSVRLELLTRSATKSSQVGPTTVPTAETTYVSVPVNFATRGEERTISWSFGMRKIATANVDITLEDESGNSLIPGGEQLADDYAIDYAGWRLWQGSITIDGGDEISVGEHTVHLRFSANAANAVEVRNARVYVK